MSNLFEASNGQTYATTHDEKAVLAVMGPGTAGAMSVRMRIGQP